MRKLLGFGLVVLASCGGGETPPASPPPPKPSSTPVASATAAPKGKEVTLKRNVIMLGRNCGTDVMTTSAEGAITVASDVVENGRGPHVDAVLRLAPDGTVASLQARGHHTMGTKVAETFTSEGGVGRWKSNEEDGARALTVGGKRAFYLPSAKMPSAVGLLAQALLKNGGTLPLLPDGQARIDKTGDTTVKVGAREKHIVGYTISGLDLAPLHIWMNDDGTWFGTFSHYDSYVPEGWEPVVDALVEKQTQLDREHDAKIARALAHKPPAAGLAFTHARVLDVIQGRYKDDQTVVVVGETIKTVGPSASVKVPVGAEVIESKGKTLVPGLWDMHSHLTDADGVLDVASGVTMARDVGNDPDKLDDFKKRYDEGTAVGPHVIRYGFIEGRNEKAASSKITAETETEAKAAVAFFAKRGYEGIKIYNSVKPELVPILAREAHARRMFVTGHIPVHMLAHEAVKAGYDGIEHINMLFNNFFATHDTDTRDTTRFTLMGEKAATFDLKGKPATEFFALLRSKKTVIDPTVGVFQDLLVGKQGKLLPGIEGMVARLPVQQQRTYLLGGLPLEGKEEVYRASWDKVLAMLKTLHEQKIPLVAGTDAIGGLWLHHELELFAKAGIPNADVLRYATIESARSLRLEAKTGSIAEGKVADLFVLDGDPLARIEDLENVESTVRGGVVFSSGKLYEAVNVKPLRP
jgi:imidazolonepropionase-like amidohydrolase